MRLSLLKYNQSDSVLIGIYGFDIMHILLLVGGSLGEPHSNMENGKVVHMQRTMVKNGIAHTTVVWYSGSCTNKHDKLTDTSIQLLCNVKLIGFVY